MNKNILENELNDLYKKLSDLKVKIQSKFDTFEPKSDEYEKWKEGFISIHVENLLKDIDNVLNLLKAPIFVCFLGRYSHGKTALINAIFDIPEEYTLPEGEGVITSKITRVEFIKDSLRPKAYKVYRGGKKEEISIDDLRYAAKSKENELEGFELIEYLHLQLPATKEFSEKFAEKRISLIDMPGLGGPYFKDNEITRAYIQNADALIIVIKITEIDKAGKVLKRTLSSIKIPPTICVFTFYDKVKESIIFKNINEDEEIQNKAIELAKEHIPSLERYLDTRSIFVSSKTKLNIPQLRQLILDLVEEKMLAINKPIDSKIPDAYKKKISEINTQLKKLLKDLDKFINDLKNSISFERINTERDILSFRLFNRIEKEEKRELKRLKSEIRGELKALERELIGKLNQFLNLNTENEIISFINEMEEDISNNIKALEIKVNEEFNTSVKPIYKEAINSFLLEDLINLPKNKVLDIQNRLNDIIDDFSLHLNPVYEVVQKINLKGKLNLKLAEAKSKDFLSRILQGFTHPPIIISALAGFVLLSISEYLPSFLGKDFLKGLGIIAIIGSILYALFLNPARRVFLDSLKKDHYNFMKGQIQQMFLELNKIINEVIDKSIAELKEEINGELFENELRDYYEDFKNLKSIVNKVEEDIMNTKEKIRNVMNIINTT